MRSHTRSPRETQNVNCLPTRPPLCFCFTHTPLQQAFGQMQIRPGRGDASDSGAVESVGPALVIVNISSVCRPCPRKNPRCGPTSVYRADFKVRVTEITTDSQINCLLPSCSLQSFFKPPPPPPRLNAAPPVLLSSPLHLRSGPLSGSLKPSAINKAYYGLLT